MDEDEPYREIPLRNKKREIIAHVKCSIQDYDHLMQFSWYLSDGYVNGKNMSMHKYIKTVIEGQTIPIGHVVDHIKNDRLDNRRSKLRIVTMEFNLQNQKKRKGTKFTGVKKNKKGRFVTSIQISNIRYTAGTYDDEIEAAEARDIFIVNYPGPSIGHPLAFPEKRESYIGKEFNTRKRTKGKSGYHGVIKRGKKYFARVKVNGKETRIGSDFDVIECAKKYDTFVIEHGLNKAVNFVLDYVPPKPIKTNVSYFDFYSYRLDIGQLGQNVIIDIGDYDRIKYYKWRIRTDKHGYHQIVAWFENMTISLNRFLMNETSPIVLIDHIDGNPLNNRKNNLRRTNIQGNIENKNKNPNASSQYHGVAMVGNKFVARVTHNYENVYREVFDDEIEAAKAQDNYIDMYLPKSLKRRNFNFFELVYDEVQQKRHFFDDIYDKCFTKKHKI